MSAEVHRHGLIEITLESDRTYSNPLWDCALEVDLRGPSGRRHTIRGFWDGGRVWRFRFSPAETGTWSWESRCRGALDEGLHAREGMFECTLYTEDNPVFRHGPLEVSASGRFLRHADGTPFFWLGDTAWNGVIRGDDANWERYVKTRAAQRFSVIQFVCSHWRGDAVDECGEASCDEVHPIHVNPGFFQRLDRRVAMINEAGLVAAPVVLWSLLETDVGYKLPEEDAMRLASYIVARYDAHQVVWLLGGDGNYRKMGVDRWKSIGRSVFKVGHGRLATLHPCGQSWVGEEFREEDWYDFIGYQSGHGDSDEHVAWLVQGPPASQWRQEPVKPIINLEPNYETALGYHQRTAFSDYHVRRAAYWSLLVSPTAGVTYGHDAIWNWNFETGPSEGHGGWHDRRVPPWHSGLETDGIRCMTILRDIVDGLDWPTFTPAQDALAVQPGRKDPTAFVACARSAAGTVVAYAPRGGQVCFRPNVLSSACCRLLDPRTGASHEIDQPAPSETLTLPDERDWLVICG